MKRAWEIAGELFAGAVPVIRDEEEQTWTDNVDVSGFYDQNLSLDWGSRGTDSIPEKYLHPAFERLDTYMRGEYREITMDALVEKTVQAVLRAQWGLCYPGEDQDENE